jgi:3-isopropylmalate/(R)-2-methylmalate dehydratase large subunit
MSQSIPNHSFNDHSMNVNASQTLYDKLWQMHLIAQNGETDLIYIDRHLLHEVTSPQAFENIAQQNRLIWRKTSNIAVVDHNVPTDHRELGIDGIVDQTSKQQIQFLEKNCAQNDILHLGINDIRQGIVHVMGPEQGATLPGMTIVCGDSHTSTHGAFGALAFGIGTSEVEHVLATQTLMLKKAKNMRVHVTGVLPECCSAKDIVLYIIRHIGTDGGTGYTIEFSGPAIEALSIEGRMTLCNMAIEAGARAGLVAVDAKTIAYFKDKPFAPKGELWQSAVEFWQHLKSDADAYFDAVINLDISALKPQVSWGTSPQMVVGVDECVPFVEDLPSHQQASAEKALLYMGLHSGQMIETILLDRVFIGSCTNSRIEDLRQAAQIIKKLQQLGMLKVAKHVKQAMVVPGSGLVKKQAEAEGLDQVFINAGFEWRAPGCSMCLAMNPDKLLPKEHCASTSNRNFEGRQGNGGRTHLVSPAMAAAAAIFGHFYDISQLN